jgi:quercetin dioxygenase-like cupin family protein
VTIRADSFEAFEAEARRQGFDEVLVREWKPAQVMDTHTHPFAIDALVVRGEFTLRCGGEERHLKAGDGFELPRDVPHSEHYGPEGATFWVARRR